MLIRNAATAIALTVLCSSAMAVPTQIEIDQTFDNWSNATVNNRQTVSWTFDFSDYGLTDASTINSASLSITARGVDAYADQVKVEASIPLGILTPGSGSTTFDLLGTTASYEFLLDGRLNVSVTANELRTYQDQHSYTDTHYYTYKHTYREKHTYRHYHWWCLCTRTHSYYDTHYRYDTHSYTDTHVRSHTHTAADSLELVSSRLMISAQTPHDVPEPAMLLLILTGLVGIYGFRTRVGESAGAGIDSAA